MSTIEQTQQAIPTGTWQLDPAHSQVGFAVDYMGGTFRGSFSPVEAALVVAEDGTATFSGSTRADSIKVQDENLAAHLLSPEFFDAERTPELGFASTAVERSGDEVVVTGELTIKGNVAPIELSGTIVDPITDAYGRERVNFALSTAVDRTVFGLDWNLALPSGEPALANDVVLSAELYLIKA